MISEAIVAKIYENDPLYNDVIIEGNTLDLNDIEKFCNALEKNTNIKSISISKTNLDDEMVARLCNCLKRLPIPIVRLGIQDNKTTFKSQLVILDTLGEKLSQFQNSEIEGIDFDKLQETTDRIPETQNKDIILVVGRTGSGKTTTVDYLIGKRMRKTVFRNNTVIDVAEDEKDYGKIGHGANAETNFPMIYQSKEMPFYYCDCPGFDDNRGDVYRMCVAISMRAAITYAKTVRGIIITIDYNDILVRALGFNKLLQTMSNFFDDPVKFKDSLYYVFTKVPENVTKKEIIDQISNMIADKECINSNPSESNHERTMELIFLRLIISNIDHILLVNPLDKGESLTNITKCFTAPRSIPINEFRFTEHTDVHMQIKTYAGDIIQIGDYILNLLFQHLDKIHFIESELVTHSLKNNGFGSEVVNLIRKDVETEQQLSNYLRWNDDLRRVNAKKIQVLQARIQKHLVDKEECDQILQKIDTDELMFYKADKWSGTFPDIFRAQKMGFYNLFRGRGRGFGFGGPHGRNLANFPALSYIFTYNDIPFEKAVPNCDNGNFSEINSQPIAGKFSAKFTPPPRSVIVCNATVTFYVKSKNHPDNAVRIRDVKNRKIMVAQEVSTLQEQVDQLLALNNQLIADLTKSSAAVLDSLNAIIKKLEIESKSSSELLQQLLFIKETALLACFKHRRLFDVVVKMMQALGFIIPGSYFAHFFELFTKFQHEYPHPTSGVMPTAISVANAPLFFNRREAILENARPPVADQAALSSLQLPNSHP